MNFRIIRHHLIFILLLHNHYNATSWWCNTAPWPKLLMGRTRCVFTILYNFVEWRRKTVSQSPYAILNLRLIAQIWKQTILCFICHVMNFPSVLHSVLQNIQSYSRLAQHFVRIYKTSSINNMVTNFKHDYKVLSAKDLVQFTLLLMAPWVKWYIIKHLTAYTS